MPIPISDDDDGAMCEFCAEPGATEMVECEDGTIVWLHRFRCVSAWAWDRLRERAH